MSGSNEALKNLNMTGERNSQIPCGQYTDDCMIQPDFHDTKVCNSHCICNRFVMSTCSYGSLIQYLGSEIQKFPERRNKSSEISINPFRIGIVKAARESVLAASGEV